MTDEKAMKLLDDWVNIKGYVGGYDCDKDWEEDMALALNHLSSRLGLIRKEKIHNRILTCDYYKDSNICHKSKVTQEQKRKMTEVMLETDNVLDADYGANEILNILGLEVEE
jgi:hypothetical protein